MRFAAAVFLASLLLVPPALADSDKDWQDCASDDADRIIAACDRIIAEGNERKVNFAIAYYNRGVGYQKKGDHAKAIADFTRSMKINASDPKTFRRAALLMPTSASTTSPSPTTPRPSGSTRISRASTMIVAGPTRSSPTTHAR